MPCFCSTACVTRQALIFIFNCIWQPMFITGKTRVSFWQDESENICSVSHVWKMSMRLIIFKLIMKIGKNCFFLSLPLWFASLINAIFKCFSLIEPLYHTSLFMFGTFFSLAQHSLKCLIQTFISQYLNENGWWYSCVFEVFLSKWSSVFEIVWIVRGEILEKCLSSVQFHRAIDRIFMEIVNAFCGMGKTMRH